MHPSELATVKPYVPPDSAEIRAELPVPDMIVPAGFMVMIHIPLEGSPLNPILPVESVQVG